jgi:hypothetical protein
MKHLEQFAVSFLLNSSFTYPPVKPPMKPVPPWKGLIFGKREEMRGHILEVEFLTLDPKTFDNLKDFFTKYKDFLSQLKVCGVDKYKEEKQTVLTILSKLGLEYSMFVSMQ